jgi:negative regulator of flagellin synthesis FlgM
MIDEIRASGVNFGTSPIGRLGAYSQGSKSVKGSGMEVTDSVEISELATLRSKYAQMPEIRTDLVAQIRTEIANGTYETPEKMDQAIENLLEELV